MEMTHMNKNGLETTGYQVGKRWLASLMITTALGTVSVALPVQAQSISMAQSQQHNFNISAQSLTNAFPAFSRQAGLQISAHGDLVREMQTSGVSGLMTVEQALEKLLAGTGLNYKISGSTITLEKKSQGSDNAARRLDVISLESQRGDGTTENTTSYTTSSMSTATKLPLSIRETPQSVTVITRQRMDDQAMVNLADIIDKTPGLTTKTFGVGRPSFYSRGFFIETITQDGINGAFSCYIPSPLSNLAMYDRAEVVRGSTGLTQGSGNPSAAINLFRKRPTDELQASFTASLGSWRNVSGTVDISGPVAMDGKISGRFVAYGQDGEGFRDSERKNSKLLYTTFDFELSEKTTLNIGYANFKDFTNMVWGGFPLNADGSHIDLPRTTYVGNDWEYITQNVNTLYASVEHNFDSDWVARLNTTYVDTSTKLLGTWLYAEDPGYVGYNFYYWAGFTDTVQRGADLYVSGPITLFDRRHDVVFGATTNRSKSDSIEHSEWYFARNVDIMNWDASSVESPIIPNDTGSSNSTHRYQESIYATARINPADFLKIIGGVRVDWFESESTWSSQKTNAHPTIYGGVVLDIDQNHSAYASYTDIFKPQNQVDINRKTLAPINGKNYEIGVKGAYFDERLNVSAAVFQIDQSNRAKILDDQSSCPIFPSASCYESTGLIQSQGIDIEIQGAITESWEIGAGYTYSHTEYVKDADLLRIGERVDTELPEHLFKLTTTYKLPGNMNKWRVGGSLSYQSEIYESVAVGSNTVRNNQDAYTLVDLMIEYKPTDALSIRLNAENIFDENYYSAISSNISWGSSEMFGTPRNFMLTLRYDM
ncbi:MAG: TonB-dependent siderophore receptor [Emcibacteraceae bacterium]|nr:TonB-dependent siderophore receptor [Emcibacteraceae bacterium]